MNKKNKASRVELEPTEKDLQTIEYIIKTLQRKIFFIWSKDTLSEVSYYASMAYVSGEIEIGNVESKISIYLRFNEDEFEINVSFPQEKANDITKEISNTISRAIKVNDNPDFPIPVDDAGFCESILMEVLRDKLSSEITVKAEEERKQRK